MDTTRAVKYNYEYRRRIKAGFIGCGGHSYRNLYPVFQYTPVELVSVCDLDEKRASHFASSFGARSVYTDYRRMLRDEKLDAVFVVTNYSEDFKPRFPEIATDIMNAGCHAWIEKPPASSSREILKMMSVEKATGKFTMVGFKKMFFPAIRELKRIISSKEFGVPGSICLKYPQGLPAEDKRGKAKDMQWFLDHIVHPASVMQYLMGPVESAFFQNTTINRDTVVCIRFVSGAVGSLHLTAGQSQTSPLERVEVIGKNANAIVENGIRLIYYRPGRRGEGGYSNGSSFIGKQKDAPVFWEPEFSLGELCNKALFMLGYVGEVMEFCDCVLKNRKPDVAGLGDALEIMKFYEAFINRDAKIIRINRERDK